MNRKVIQTRRYFNVLFLLMVCMSIMLLGQPTVGVMQLTNDSLRESVGDKPITIVIDAGHGGRDPGKVGVNNALEKDINLGIALKLKEMLEQNEINVIMTREDDNGLYSEGDSNRKAADLRNRVTIINHSEAVLAVSIHQNSFTQESSKGAQVFYYSRSTEGKVLAEAMQDQLKKSLQDGNRRFAKSNDSYYMLTKSNCTLIIVECGYLSNQLESELLITDAYQEKMAWAIHLGLLSYINQHHGETTSNRVG